MDALKARDSLFSDLHNSILKPLGFRKRGHWSVSDISPVVQCVYLRASRWGSRSNAIFYLDIQVFSSEWYELILAPAKFPGPLEGIMCPINYDLGLLCTPLLGACEIDASTDLSALKETLATALQAHALPIFEQCRDHGGILSYLASLHNTDQYAFEKAGLAKLLKQDQLARQFMRAAKERASHDNHLAYLLGREKVIWPE
ncbi:DUF4304 domain-containing protein [Rugamonas sp. A1-17]|nr:DUF4304 domain-containing protein [Rugamonas sp. A1-17]